MSYSSLPPISWEYCPIPQQAALDFEGPNQLAVIHYHLGVHKVPTVCWTSMHRTLSTLSLGPKETGRKERNWCLLNVYCISDVMSTTCTRVASLQPKQ